ncbi:response regulator [Paenibacillus alkalitolerans]|uniref:response regulator n=1 Tax=Paenibacillus alkalitolerans TaxID=2799335 RepID=UPI0018F32015|nr:response regulator [Paenibacillus alkalitolerans]
MYSLLIVEDERWEREGLAELWDWRELGIEIAGTAADGADGYEKAMLLQPDIIITDIRMPGMSGLEMAKSIRTRNPDVRIVVLTGYGDFEYMREAITLSADDYVLKPIEEEELRQTMIRVVKKCDEIGARRLEESRLLQRLQLGERIAAEKLLLDLLSGRGGDLEELAAELLGLDAGMNAPGYAVMAVVPRETVPGEAVRRTAGAGAYIVGCDDFAGGFTVVLPVGANGDADVGEEPKQLAERLLAAWDEMSSSLPTVGVAAPALSLVQLKDAYRQAVEAAGYGVFYGIGGAVVWEDAAEGRRRFGELSHDFHSQWQELSRQLRMHVLALQPSAVKDMLERMFGLVRMHPGAGKEYITALINVLLIELSMLDDDRQPDGKPGDRELLALNRLDEIQGRVQEYAARLMERLDSKRNRKDDYIAEKTIRLIEEKYGSKELSLTMLAEEAFVSPNHLGVLFKKATGVTVHQYITEVRMRKAEEMLRLTKRKVSEVAERIGMANHSYFCTVFKQKHGMSPGEYQELMQRR